MALYLSADEIDERLAALEGLLHSLRAGRRNIDAYAEALEDEGQTAATVSTKVNDLLTDWGALRDEIVTKLSDIPILHQIRVKIGMPALYSSARVVLNEQSNNADSSISVNESVETTISPFSAFQAGDVVSVSNAEDTENNKSAVVQHTPATPGADRITNGGFDSASGWTEASGDIAITGGKAVFTSAAGPVTLKQLKADMVGGGWTNAVRYLVTFDLDTVTAGTLAVGTNTNASQHVVTADGSHRAIILADNHADGLVFTADPTTTIDFTGNLDNVSVIPWTGLALDDVLGADNDEDKQLVITLQER